MVELIYFEALPEVAHVRCERMRATVQQSRCAAHWREANEQGNAQRQPCVRCPIGAELAGADGAALSPLCGASLCARCHRPTDRLVGGHRCVSCYNREREWAKGCNAKGSRPVRMRPLGPHSLQYFEGDELRRLSLPLAADTDELVIAALRDSRKKVRFAFVAPPVRQPQMGLFPGVVVSAGKPPRRRGGRGGGAAPAVPVPVPPPCGVQLGLFHVH